MNEPLTIQEVLDRSREYMKENAALENECFQQAKDEHPSGTPWVFILRRAQEIKKREKRQGGFQWLTIGVHVVTARTNVGHQC